VLSTSSAEPMGVPTVEVTVGSLATASTSTLAELITMLVLLSVLKRANVDPAIRLKHKAIVRMDEIKTLDFIFCFLSFNKR
jgi:hypothetical protein